MRTLGSAAEALSLKYEKQATNIKQTNENENALSYEKIGTGLDAEARNSFQ
jgi:hypothetical protein